MMITIWPEEPRGKKEVTRVAPYNEGSSLELEACSRYTASVGPCVPATLRSCDPVAVALGPITPQQGPKKNQDAFRPSSPEKIAQ